MRVKVSEIRKNVSSLSNLIDDYENNYLNMCNVLNEANNSWNGEKSLLFYDKTNSEQGKVHNNINEIRSLISVYNYIVSEYSNFGNDVFFNVSKKDGLATFFNIYLEMVRQIIRVYDSFPASYNYLIDNQRRYFISLEQQIRDIKNKFNSSLDSIDNIEDKISQKISKISIDVIKESDVRKIV